MLARHRNAIVECTLDSSFDTMIPWCCRHHMMTPLHCLPSAVLIRPVRDLHQYPHLQLDQVAVVHPH